MGLLKKILAGRQRGEFDSQRPSAPVPAPSVAEDGAVLRTQAIESANALNAAGQHAHALATIDAALERAPDDGALVAARGSTLYEWGRAREAHEWLLRAEALDPDDTSLSLKLGWTCFVAGLKEEALSWMRKAVAAESASIKARFGLGIALQANALHDEATQAFADVVARDPENFDALIQLGGCRLDAGDPAGAEQLYRRALGIDPSNATAWTDLGAALCKQDRNAEAIEAFEAAERIEAATGQDVENFINLAVAHGDDGRHEESLVTYERNLMARPIPRGHFGYAGTLLRAGRIREGWSHYEYRWAAEPYHSNRARYGKPTWNGQDLGGRTILLHSEQGFGDSLQFLRYAPMLKALGATVVLRAIPGLEELARRIRGIDHVIGNGDPLPDFDFYVHLMSLPRVFDTSLETIPAEVPYVHPEPLRAARWAERLAPEIRMKVGVAWAGNPRHERDRYRSIPPGVLTPLAEIDGVRLISLQKGSPAVETAATPLGRGLWDMTDELTSYEDTAALIDALDLVIAVDTSVLHLAGSMGKPVWALLPSPADFRWLESREDSPWYPSMRLFRQTRRNDWREVIDRVAVVLRKTVAVRHDAATIAPQPATPGGAPRSASRPNAGAAPGVRPGFFALAETRLGLLQFRPHDVPVGRSLDWYGEYLQLHVALLPRIVAAGGTVLEVAAGMGAHSVVLASLLGSNGQLLLYEDDPILRRVLQQNLAMNGAKNVTVMRRKLAGPSGADARNGATPAPPPSSETVDDLRLRRLDLLKVNSAALGLDIVDGAAETLWRLRPTLLIAAADEPSLGTLGERAQALGYRCFRVGAPLFDPRNFNLRNDDIFQGQVALALLALPEEKDEGLVLPGCVELA